MAEYTSEELQHLTAEDKFDKSFVAGSWHGKKECAHYRTVISKSLTYVSISLNIILVAYMIYRPPITLGEAPTQYGKSLTLKLASILIIT